MSYNDAQLQATKAFILDFFRPKSKPSDVILTQFEKHISRSLDQLKIYNPDDFKFKKNNASEPYLIKWIDENILPFPEDFSVTLTKEGNSFAIIADETIVIFEAGFKTTKKNKPSNIPSDLNFISNSSSSSGSIPMSLCSCTPEPKAVLKTNQTLNTSPVYEISDYRTLEQDLIELENKTACLSIKDYTTDLNAKKSLVRLEGEKLNNLYSKGDAPKYVEGSSGPMYIPIYTKNKYGFAYGKSSQINKHAQKSGVKLLSKDMRIGCSLQEQDHLCFFEPDWKDISPTIQAITPFNLK